MIRFLLGVVGVVAVAYGVVLLLATGLDNTGAAVWWLAGGVLVHDGVLAPVTLLIGLAVSAWVPPAWRRVTVGALVVVGTVTVMAIPVLGGFGARADNPSLLDRPYLLGWLGLVLLVTTAMLLAELVVRRPWDARSGRRRDGARPGR